MVRGPPGDRGASRIALLGEKVGVGDGTDTRFTRRTLIGSAAAGAAVAGLSGAAPRARAATAGKTPKEVDVAVVGAGLAGLTAARAVAAAGRSVIVVEARDQGGGVTWQRPTTGGSYPGA